VANILIVDDEVDVLDALVRALRLAGHTVQGADTADKALALCADHSFDIAVLDYLMPSMSGIELLNEILRYIPTIRSVIVSGKIDAEISEEALTAELRDRIEADAYLHKPVDNPKLLETIKPLIDKVENRSWVEIAERNINAKKRKADVQDAEQSLRRLRRKKKD
jgi:two-component system NtrC family response regulator/two-component system response regulator AtoC